MDSTLILCLGKRKEIREAQVACNQKDLHFEQRLGVLVDSSHGVSIKLTGSVNFSTMYSVSSSKVWVFAIKLVGSEDDGDGVVVKLMRCAVIKCCRRFVCTLTTNPILLFIFCSLSSSNVTILLLFDLFRLFFMFDCQCGTYEQVSNGG